MNDQPTAKSVRILPKLENFPGRAADVIRFGDLDAQGHVNNAVFATYFETGRVVLLRQPGNELNIPGTTSVLARIDINYLRELHWPGRVDIGTGVAHIGRSSYSFAQALFRDDVCVATANATIVVIDTKTRRPQLFAEQVRARLETLRVTAA